MLLLVDILCVGRAHIPDVFTEKPLLARHPNEFMLSARGEVYGTYKLYMMVRKKFKNP